MRRRRRGGEERREERREEGRGKGLIGWVGVALIEVI